MKYDAWTMGKHSNVKFLVQEAPFPEAKLTLDKQTSLSIIDWEGHRTYIYIGN